MNVEDSVELKAKSQTGKFPILETVHGHTIFESISIAKYFARQQKGFYGHNDYESKRNRKYFNAYSHSILNRLMG